MFHRFLYANAVRFPTVRYRCLLVATLFLGGALVPGKPAIAASPPAGTVIENQATGSFTDTSDNSTKTVLSDIVTLKVAEVAGITLQSTGVDGQPITGNTVYFRFLITNVGNDPTQFFIPNATALLIVGGVQNGEIQVVEYDADGAGSTAPIDLTSNNITVPLVSPNSGSTTGTLLNGVAGTNNGSVPAGGTITLRVPIQITGNVGSSVSVVLGDTNGRPTQNQPYIADPTLFLNKDLYTVDNSGTTNGDTSGDPLNGDALGHRQEASATGLIAVIAPLTQLSISGTVFEDVNYGGGAGRNLINAQNSALSSGFAAIDTSTFLENNIGADSARVELYIRDTVNLLTYKFLASTTTDQDGRYAFTSGLAADTDYRIRVLPATVISSRSGTPAGLVSVQTFRTDGSDSSKSPVPVANEVGGRLPAATADAPTVNTLLTDFPTQSLVWAEVKTPLVPNALNPPAITGVDFGFNFDTIVNTNDSGQGSLRQFINNSNALTNASLAQTSLTAGKETSIFMISDGASHPGLTAGGSNQLTSGVATIQVTSQLPAITDPNTTIDGTTQTANVGDTNTGTAGTGGTVGVDGLALSTVNKPEVEINDGTASVSNGLLIQANNTTVRGLAIWGFGDGDNGSANIQVSTSSSSCSGTSIFTGLLFEQNLIGTKATSFSAVSGTANNNGKGFRSPCGSQGIFRNNLVGFTAYAGSGWNNFDTQDPNMSWTIINNEFRSAGTNNLVDNVGLEAYTRNVILKDNLISGAFANGVSLYLNAANSNILIENNTITNNGSGAGSTELAGIAIFSGANGGETISKNIIQGNKGAGVWVEKDFNGVKITQNSMFNNGGLGIDLKGGDTGTGNQTVLSNTVTPNDGVVGTGVANNGLDYPVIVSSVLSSGTLTVKGYVGNNPLGSTTFSNLTLEFFIADDDGNNNGPVISGDGKSLAHGEGKTYISSCTTDANGLFDCAFANAGTVGVTSAANITATATSASGNTSEFSAPVSSNPNILLVKRITAVNGSATNGSVALNTYDPDPTYPYDKNVNQPGVTPPTTTNWPNTTGATNSTFLIGARNGGQTKPSDEVEYTIYFLSAGDAPARNVAICDRVPDHQNFVSNGYNALTAAPNGDSTSDRGIAVSYAGSLQSYTNNDDGDTAKFFPAGSALPAVCGTGTNTSGAILFNLGAGATGTNITAQGGTGGTVPNATSPGGPTDSYGFVRFKAKVN